MSAQKIDLFLGFPGGQRPDHLDALALELPAPLVVGRSDHPLLSLSNATATDFLRYPLVQGPIAQWYFDWARAEFGTDYPADLLRPYFLQATDVALLISIARNSVALLAVMQGDVGAALESGDLVEIRPPRWPDRVPAEIVWSDARPQAPAAERLVNEILRVVARLGRHASGTN